MSVTIAKLEIGNFKGIVDKSMEFNAGLTTIQGPNFSGKTTVTQALLYALYGPTVVPGKAEDMANSTKGGAPSVSVTLSDGHEVKRTGSNATLLKNGNPVARSASIVSSEVAGILGLEKDQTLKTRVSQQGEAQLLLATDNAELKRLVEDLAGCNVIDKILTLSRGYKKVLKGKAEGLQESYIGDDAVQALMQEVADAGKKVAEMEEELATAQLLLTNTEADRAATQLVLDQIKADNKLAEDLALECAQLSGATFTLEEQILVDKATIGNDTSAGLAEECEVIREKLTAAKEGLEAAKDREEAADSAARAVNSKITKIEVQAANLQKANEVLKGLPSLEDAKANLEKLVEQLAKHNAEIVRLKAAIENAACPECGRAYEENEFNLDEVTEKLAKLAVIVEKDGLSRTVESNTLHEVEKHARERDGFQVLLDSTAVELRELRTVSTAAAAATNGDDIADLRAKVKELSPLLKVLEERKSAVAVAEASLAKATEKVAKSYARLEELGKGAPEIVDPTEKEKLLADKATTIVVTKSTIAGLESGISHTKTNAQSSADRAAEAQAIGDSLKVAEKDRYMHTKLVRLINTNRASLMQNVWGGILQEATDFVSAVTEGYVSNVSVDKAFKVTYTEGSTVFPISSASGSQKSLIGLGIRLGIGNLLPNNAGFFVMDEATADMEESVSLLAMTVAKTKCQQIIAVSHRDSDMVASDSIITMARG